MRVRLYADARKFIAAMNGSLGCLYAGIVSGYISRTMRAKGGMLKRRLT